MVLKLVVKGSQKNLKTILTPSKEVITTQTPTGAN